LKQRVEEGKEKILPFTNPKGIENAKG